MLGSKLAKRFGIKVPLDFTNYRLKSIDQLLGKFVHYTPTLPGNKKVLWIRSAESLGDKEELLYGALDFELTHKGENQAKHLHKHLEKIRSHIGEVVASPSLRSVNTARLSLTLGDPLQHPNMSVEERISQHLDRMRTGAHKLPERSLQETSVRTDSRLREFAFGKLEGISIKDMRFCEKDITFQL